MKNRIPGFAAILTILVVAAVMLVGCSKKSTVSLKQVKTNIVGTWISGAIDAEYIKIKFDENGNYKLWNSSGYTNDWGDVVLSGTYSIKMDKDTGGLEFPVVILNGSAPYNYQISFRGATPMLVNANIVEVPIERTTINPWAKN